jgi:S-adenosylmethionine:tRNA ribosyltransferase-isomerase
MLVSEFDYHLPSERIAQHPAEPRDSARLMHLQTSAPLPQMISHHSVRDLPNLLRPDDLLIMNDTRVLRARLHGHKITGAKVEALLLREIERNLWEVLLRPSARLKEGSEIIFRSDEIDVLGICEKRLDNTWHLRFESTSTGFDSAQPDKSTFMRRHSEGAPATEESPKVSTHPVESTFDIRNHLNDLGEVPLPPYIHAKANDPERYQTIYSKDHLQSAAALDSAAAPTAGLHFTPQLLGAIRARGIQCAHVTLGIGLGTFLPVKSETLEDHHMHFEEYDIPESTARAIRDQKKAGKRVVAVGTTVARTLEAASANGNLQSGPGNTDIFIYPPYHFRCVDAMLTNFHLPKSTLLAMVSALADNLRGTESDLTGIKIMQHAYKIAVQEKYRFFSFGDAMFIE